MDELGPEDRALIDQAIEARTPSAADRARVKEKLMAAGVLGAAAGAAATGAAQASALSAAKIASVLALVGVTGAAVVWWASSDAPSPPEAEAEQAAANATAIEATAIEGVEEEAPEATPDEAEADATAIEATAIEATAIETTVAPEASASADEASPRLARRRRASPQGPNSLADDVALLHRAQAERGRDPASALELAREHRRRFPRSPLSAERNALRILLLCDLGRQGAAERLGERFLAQTQDSPLRRSIEESCAGQ